MTQTILKGTVLDEQVELSLNDLCCACSRPAEWVIELVEEGMLEPINTDPPVYRQTQWIFSADALYIVRTAMRLQDDLGINLAGVALALELLDRINTLETQLQVVDMRNEINGE